MGSVGLNRLIDLFLFVHAWIANCILTRTNSVLKYFCYLLMLSHLASRWRRTDRLKWILQYFCRHQLLQLRTAIFMLICIFVRIGYRFDFTVTMCYYETISNRLSSFDVRMGRTVECRHHSKKEGTYTGCWITFSRTLGYFQFSS